MLMFTEVNLAENLHFPMIDSWWRHAAINSSVLGIVHLSKYIYTYTGLYRTLNCLMLQNSELCVSSWWAGPCVGDRYEKFLRQFLTIVARVHFCVARQYTYVHTKILCSYVCGAAYRYLWPFSGTRDNNCERYKEEHECWNEMWWSFRIRTWPECCRSTCVGSAHDVIQVELCVLVQLDSHQLLYSSDNKHQKSRTAEFFVNPWSTTTLIHAIPNDSIYKYEYLPAND
jgi:hypothetical protein